MTFICQIQWSAPVLSYFLCTWYGYAQHIPPFRDPPPLLGFLWYHTAFLPTSGPSFVVLMAKLFKKHTLQMLACLLYCIYILPHSDLNSSHGLKYYKYANFYTCIYRCDFASLLQIHTFDHLPDNSIWSKHVQNGILNSPNPLPLYINTSIPVQMAALIMFSA